jgi:RNA polymerase sigma-70 factor (ECF subfamily)
VAEDLFQQTWLRVVESIRQFDARRNFDTWLFAVAHNLAIDHLRRKHPESLDAAHQGVACAAGPNALDRILAGERAEVLLAKLARLPAIHRAVLAQVLRVPLATVKSRLHRALESLRRKLEAGP